MCLNMTKKTRLLIFVICVASFLAITPNLVLYSMGYRLDLKTMKVTATGGIYVRTFPTAERISIDSGLSQKPGLFSNSIFVQNLIPTEHSVLAQKDGYFDYAKTIPVQKNQVTKLENILLIRQNIAFQKITDNVDFFSVAPNKQAILTATTGSKNISFNYFSSASDNQPQIFAIARVGTVSSVEWSSDSIFALLKIEGLNNTFYYLFDSTTPPQLNPGQTKPQDLVALLLLSLDKSTQRPYFNPNNSKEIFYIKNSVLYSETKDKELPIITNVSGYNFLGGSIIWLSTDGFLYKSDFSGENKTQMSVKSVSVKSGQNFEISVVADKVFMHADNSLLLLNAGTKIFENLPLPASSYKIILSPDQKNIAFRNGKDIYLYSFVDDVYEKIFSGDLLGNCQWLNNDYIIFTSGDKIIISEIDYRGNINTVTLPQTITLQSDTEIKVTKPEAFFNSQDGKVYFLTNKTLISSEKIIP